jgi:hypothetical protein
MKYSVSLEKVSKAGNLALLILLLTACTGRIYDDKLRQGLIGHWPLAEIYSFEGDTIWKQIARLDHTPDEKYRRAWTMAEHDWKVFCSTLPSGRIFSFEAGRNITWGDPQYFYQIPMFGYFMWILAGFGFMRKPYCKMQVMCSLIE